MDPPSHQNRINAQPLPALFPPKPGSKVRSISSSDPAVHYAVKRAWEEKHLDYFPPVRSRAFTQEITAELSSQPFDREKGRSAPDLKAPVKGKRKSLTSSWQGKISSLFLKSAESSTTASTSSSSSSSREMKTPASIRSRDGQSSSSLSESSVSSLFFDTDRTLYEFPEGGATSTLGANLESVNFEKLKLNFNETLKQGDISERDFYGICEFCKKYKRMWLSRLQNDPESQENGIYLRKADTDLSHTLEITPIGKIIVYTQEIIGRGTFKTVAEAFLLVEQVNITNAKTRIDGLSIDFQSAEKEQSMLKLFGNKLGMPRTYLISYHQRSHEGTYSEIPCQNILQRRYAGSLNNFKKLFPEGLSEQDLRFIGNQALASLSTMHTGGYSHSDIHAGNFLYALSKDDQLLEEVVITDFGCAYRLDEKIDKIHLNLTNAPPEYLLKKKDREYSGDKHDVWALGCMLYELTYNKKTPWLASYEKEKMRVSSENSGHKHALEKLKKHLKQLREPNEAKDPLAHLIWQMLQINPLERIGVEEALNILQTMPESDSAVSSHRKSFQSLGLGGSGSLTPDLVVEYQTEL